jgi:hypothetical protein
MTFSGKEGVTSLRHARRDVDAADTPGHPVAEVNGVVETGIAPVPQLLAKGSAFAQDNHLCLCAWLRRGRLRGRGEAPAVVADAAVVGAAGVQRPDGRVVVARPTEAAGPVDAGGPAVATDPAAAAGIVVPLFGAVPLAFCVQ